MDAKLTFSSTRSSLRDVPVLTSNLSSAASANSNSQYLRREERLRQLEKERGLVNQIYSRNLQNINSSSYPDTFPVSKDPAIDTSNQNDTSKQTEIFSLDNREKNKSTSVGVEYKQDSCSAKTDSFIDTLKFDRYSDKQHISRVQLEKDSCKENHRRTRSLEKSKIHIPTSGRRPKSVSRPTLASQAKYYSTDKTLLILLDDEREKYSNLENEYYNLLSEVQSLQANHIRDLKLSSRKHESETSSLRENLANKSDNCESLQKELSYTTVMLMDTKKRLDECSEDSKKLDFQASRLSNILVDTESRLNEVLSELKIAKEKHRKLESGWFKEKEIRMKLDVQILQLDHFIHQRDDQITKLQSLISTRDTQIAAHQSQLENLSKKLEEEIQRNNNLKSQYSTKMSTATAQFHVLQNKLTELQQSDKVFQTTLQTRDETISKLTQNHALQLHDISIQLNAARTVENELKTTIQLRDSAIEKNSEMIAILQNKLLSQMDEARNNDDNLRNAIRQRDTTVSRTLEESQTRIRELQSHLREREERFATEVEAIRNKKQQELVTVQEKFEKAKGSVEAECASLRTQLSEASEKIKQVEVALRETLISTREKDIELNQCSTVLAQQDVVVREKTQLVENLKMEILQLRRDIDAATSSEREKDAFLFERETILREKDAVIRDKDVTVSMMATELQQKDNTIIARDSVVAEKQRAIDTLQSQHQHEIQLVNLQNNALMDHVKRLQDEINGYRSMNAQKDKDLVKLQGNVTELSRRLRAQVDLLLDAENEIDSDRRGDEDFPEDHSRGTSSSPVGLINRKQSTQSVQQNEIKTNSGDLDLKNTNIETISDYKSNVTDYKSSNKGSKGNQMVNDSQRQYIGRTISSENLQYLPIQSQESRQQQKQYFTSNQQQFITSNQQISVLNKMRGMQSQQHLTTSTLNSPKISSNTKSCSEGLNNPLLSVFPKADSSIRVSQAQNLKIRGVENGKIVVGMDNFDE